MPSCTADSAEEMQIQIRLYGRQARISDHILGGLESALCSKRVQQLVRPQGMKIWKDSLGPVGELLVNICEPQRQERETVGVTGTSAHDEYNPVTAKWDCGLRTSCRCW